MSQSGGTTLRKRREKTGKSAEWLGRHLGVAPKVVHGWESAGAAISPALLNRALDALEPARRKPRGSAPAPLASQDPLLQEIEDALAQHIDDQVFERCMADLLRDIYPSLVPVMGGADGGSDGVTAVVGGNPPTHLISTTQKDQVANFKKNLGSLRKNHPETKHVLFACSTPVSGHKRKKLKAAAAKEDFALVQTYDRDALIPLLRDRPDIAADLLNVSGAPRALTQSCADALEGPEVPLALGRQDDFEWIIRQKADCLVVGEPGMGKAHLLSAAAQQGEALFLDGAERTQAANEVRRTKPLAIMVPNAHTSEGVAAVQMLQSIRKQVGATFRIIASSLPGKPASTVRRILNLPKGSVRNLAPMDADETAAIVKKLSKGRLPDDVVAVIRRQAHGKPGLAAQLTRKFFVGDGGEAVTGEALYDILTENLDEEALDLLAVLSLGGEYGMVQQTAIDALSVVGKSPSDFHQALQSANAHGVVESARARPSRALSEALALPDKQRHAVVPYDLRCVMICRAIPYWSSTGTLDRLMGLFTPQSREAEDAVGTLIGAAMRQAHIPNLSEWVERQKKVRLIVDYAHVDRDAVVWACQQYPSLMGKLAEPLLNNAPDLAIRLLLDHLASAGGADERKAIASLSPEQDTVLYQLRRWTSGGEAARMCDLLGEQLQRRRQIVSDVTHWLDRQAGDAAESQLPALAFMCMALSPAFEFEGSDPGLGDRLTIRHGILSSKDLRDVADLWPLLLSSLRSCPDSLDAWEMLTSLAWDWMAPQRCGHVEPNEDQKAVSRHAAAAMLQDLAQLSRTMKGVQLRLKRMAEYIELDLNITDQGVLELQVLDPVYQKNNDKDLDAWAKESNAAAHQLGEKWGRLGAAHMVSMLDGALLDIRYSKTPASFIDVIPAFCDGAAGVLDDECTSAVKLMIAKNMWQQHVAPFMRVCVELMPAGWESVLRQCLSREAYAYSAIEAIMTHDGVAEGVLGDLAFNALIKLPPTHHSAVEVLAVRDQLPERHLLAALRLCGDMQASGDEAHLRLAVGAAVGHWQARKQAVASPRMLDAWQQAVVQSAYLDVRPNDHDLYLVGEILSCDGALALRWMREALTASQQGVSGTLLADTAVKAVNAMNKQARETLLDEAAGIGITPSSYFCAMDWVPVCVGDDPDLYARLLTHASLADLHGHPLAGDFTMGWRQKALAALKKYNEEWVPAAPWVTVCGWLGSARSVGK